MDILKTFFVAGLIFLGTSSLAYGKAQVCDGPYWKSATVEEVKKLDKSQLNKICESGDYRDKVIHRAAEHGSAPVLKEFLKREGLHINTVDILGNTALVLALKLWGREEAARLLIEAGANLDIPNRYRETALMWAVRRRYKKIVKLVVDREAYLDMENDWGETALAWAVWTGDEEIVELLIKGKANVNAADKDGVTPLMWAAGKGSKEIAGLLIKAEAKLDRANSYGYTALIIASMWGHGEVVKLLVEEGADLHKANNDGETALSVAEERGHKEVVELLKKHGAS